jgi:4-hydroxybenzoate polyprenyltransferase
MAEGPILYHVIAAFLFGALAGYVLDDLMTWVIDRHARRSRRNAE